MKKIIPLGLIAIVTPVVASASWLGTVALQLLSLLKILTPVIIGAGFVVFIWGLVVFLARSGNPESHAEGRRKMLWGIIILFIMLSVWAIVRLVQVFAGIGPGAVNAPSILY